MSKIEEAVKDAKVWGWSKFKDEGVSMVVCTQSELDAVLKQQRDKAVEEYIERCKV